MKARPGLLFIISGPSGSGKTTLLKKVLSRKSLRHKLAKSISVTTRPKRSGESQGEDYFFVRPEAFRRLKKAKKILEWTRYLGYYYGTKKDFLEENLKSGRHLALCLDIRGALKLKKLFPKNTVTIFIIPPSLKELRKRIEGRCCRTKPEEVNKRVSLAQAELQNSRRYDYVVKNNNLTRSTARLGGIILNKIRALKQ
ncbi:MAG: guanylate kinase [Candidatus Omnitrophica bacterium]|nr:guanylate kinase [Candidatus Omnitrophota bacterium]MDD5027757.1 guanylate kinase [Candidatus Omnitrophota bacterium]MDD5661570.1 guanylate kinase [Candidatus Omnitrophota bacterium]